MSADGERSTRRLHPFPATASSAAGEDPMVPSEGGAAGLIKEHSGLLADEQLRGSAADGELDESFELGGSAPPRHRIATPGAEGLSVGVHAPESGTWEGFFAVSRTAYPASSVFHVAMSRDVVGVPGSDQSGEAVFAVQTARTAETGVLNYVLAASTTNNGLTRWIVGHAKGFDSDAALTVLWGNEPLPPSAAKVGQEITLRTDGQSRLDVWFGSDHVYATEHGLDLDIEPPLRAYLEVQALKISYSATFTDYWVAADDSIVVSGLRHGEQVVLAHADGTHTRATAAPDGEVRLTVPLPKARGQGVLRFEGSGGLSFGPLWYAGGDRYRVTY